MSFPPRSAQRRAEAWLWTGPVGHLLGGTLDFLQALMRYRWARLGPHRFRPVWRRERG
jgi:hypothetical protein